MQRYNITKNKHSNKKVKKIEESRVRCQRFHSYFHHMLFTKKMYYFDLKKRYTITVISPIKGDNQWTKCYLLLWLALMILGMKKISMNLCVFSQPGDGSGKKICSLKLFFYQCGIKPNITVIFWGTGRGIVDFDKQAYKDDVLLF